MTVNIKIRNPEMKKEKAKLFSKQWWKSNIFAILSILSALVLIATFIMCFVVAKPPIPDYILIPVALIHVCLCFIFITLMNPDVFRMTRKEWYQYNLISKAVSDRTIRKVMVKDGGHKIILLVEAENKRLENIVLDNYNLVQSCDTQYMNIIEMDCYSKEIIYYYANLIPCNKWLKCEITEY